MLLSQIGPHACKTGSALRFPRILVSVLMALAGAVPARAGVNEWLAAVASGTPATYVETNIVVNGLVSNIVTRDIGPLTGARSFEFIVNASTTGSSVSSALMGNNGFAFKFEQYYATGHYGITNISGTGGAVGDLSFVAPTVSDTVVHLVFVSDAGATRLFENGLARGSVPTETLLAGLVDIGGWPRFARDPLEGEILGVATYDSALGAAEIRAHAVAALPVPIVDFNGDGLADVVFANYLYDNPNRVCLGNGAGGFTACANVGDAGFAANGVAVGDVDADGDLDLVFAGGQSNRLCLNNGSGSFTCTVLASENADDVALGDVDGDGDLDAVFVAYYQRERVCKNNGSGAFTCANLGATDVTQARDVALGDLDGDGDLDAIIAAWNGSQQHSRVCLNNGSGAFTCADLPDALTTVGVGLADLDGDGDLDAVLANLFDANRVCLNNGNATFTCADLSADRFNTQDVALGDVDGDGDVDAVFPNFNYRDRLCRNNGSGSFTCAEIAADTTLLTRGVALGDVDADGDLDAVFGNDNQVNRVCTNNGGGSFTCANVSADAFYTLDVALQPAHVRTPANSAPVAVCHPVVTLAAGAGCSATVTPGDVDNGSHDPDPGDTLSFAVHPAGPFALGTTHAVTLTVTDRRGASSSCTATVSVADPDGDGACGSADNCPTVFNPGQSNIDGDADGDLCDACPGDPTNTCVPGGSTAQEIRADAGGTVQTADGNVKIEIPGKALSANTTISVTKAVVANPIVNLQIGTGSTPGVGRAFYDFEPDGLPFAHPVTLTVKVDVGTVAGPPALPALTPLQRLLLKLYRFDVPQNRFIAVPTTCTFAGNIGTCSAQIDHFSRWTVAAPDVAVLDDFDRADGELGSNWTGFSDGLHYLIHEQAGQAWYGGPIYWSQGDAFGTDQEAYATFTSLASQGLDNGLLLKVQSDPVPANGSHDPDWIKGCIGVSYVAADHSLYVATFRPDTLAWNVYASEPLTLADGDQLHAQARADGRILVFRNGEQVATFTLDADDQAFFNSRGGRIGLWFEQAATAEFDDFGGGTVTP